MIIEFRKVKQAGNNIIADMFFNSVLVATVHCSPKEFEEFWLFLVTGQMENGGSSEDITRDDRPDPVIARPFKFGPTDRDQTT